MRGPEKDIFSAGMEFVIVLQAMLNYTIIPNSESREGMTSVSHLELKRMYIVFTVPFSRKKKCPWRPLSNPNKDVISKDQQDTGVCTELHLPC